MVDINPFEAPATTPDVTAFDPTDGLWRDGNVLIVRDDATMPSRCVACNVIGDLHCQKRVLVASHWSWMSQDLDERFHPIADSLAIQISRRLGCNVMPFEYSLCSSHRAACWIDVVGFSLLFWGWIELCSPRIITMAGSLPFYMTWFGIFLCMAGFVAVLFGFKFHFGCKRDHYLCFVGAGSQFLESLPAWPGERLNLPMSMRIVGAFWTARNRVPSQIVRLAKRLRGIARRQRR